VIALETKVGHTSDTNNDSHDFKLSGVTGSDKAVSKTGSEVLTNKTLTAPVINVGSDADQDIYKRNASGVFTRIAKGSANQLLGVSADGNTVGYLALSAVTSDEKSALAGQSGTAPSASNKFIDNAMVTEAKTASKIPIRDSNGDILVATTPTAGDACASKTYVDLNFTPLVLTTTVSDTLKWSNDASVIASGQTSYAKFKEITLNENLTPCRIKFTLGGAGSGTIYGRIYKNDVAIGTEQSISPGSTVFTEDFTNFVSGDKIQLYVKMGASNLDSGVSNFRLYFTKVITSIKSIPLVTVVDTTFITNPTNNS
jgi:hypothetical protein